VIAIAPRQYFGRGFARLIRTFLIALVVLGVPSQAMGQVGAVLSAYTDLRFRGLSLSDGQPVGLADLSYDHSSGIYGALSGSIVATRHEGLKPLGLTLNAGYARRVGRKIVIVDVDPEDLAEQDVEILGVAIGVVGPSPIANGNIEITVRAKGETAAIVVGEDRVRYRDDRADRCGIGEGRIAARPGIFANLDVARRLCQENEETAVGRIVRMESESEDAALAATRELRGGDVEKERFRAGAGVDGVVGRSRAGARAL